MLLGPGTVNTDTHGYACCQIKGVAKRLQVWVNVESHYVGKYGTFAPFCKTCMVRLSDEIMRNNVFQGFCRKVTCSSRQDRVEQVSDDEWTIANLKDWDDYHKAEYAGLLAHTFQEKSKTAKDLKKDEDDVQGVAATLEATTITPGASSSSTGGLGGDHAHPPIGPTPRTCLPAEDTTDMMHIDEDEL